MKKKYSTPFLLLVLCLFLKISSFAQKSVSFFSDTLQRGAAAKTLCAVSKNQYVYIGGQSFDSTDGLTFAYAPSISKIDTSGITLWTFSTNKQTDKEDNSFGGLVYNGAYIDQLILDGDFLYVAGYIPGIDGREVWKLQEKTGDLIWKRQFSVYGSGELSLNLANSDTLVVGYNASSAAGYVYELWETRTGKTAFTKKIPQLNGLQNSSFLQLDKDGSLYISKFDSLFKYKNVYASTLLWSKRINNISVSILKPENDGNLYVFGRSNAPFASTNPLFAAKLDKTSGNTVWASTSKLLPNYLFDAPSDVKMTNSSIYISGRQTGFGSVFTAYRVWKLNRGTGATLWDKAYNSFWQNDTIPTGGNKYTSILSIDVDAAENVYASGYQQGGDNLSGVWGVCKFDGSTGKKLYQNTVHEDVAYNSLYSRGVYTFVFNNRVFYVGELQKRQVLPAAITNFGYSNIFLVASDTSGNFNPYRKKKIVAFFQYFSRVAAIKKYSVSKFLVYKQVGPVAKVEMWNSTDRSLLWSTTISRAHFTSADRLCVTTDGKIAITAFGHLPTSLQYDYKKKPDSIYFLKLDSLGKLKEAKNYYIGNQEEFASIQLFAAKDTNTVLVYTQKDRYNNSPSMHFFNVDKAITPFGDFSDYVGAVYTPIPAKQQFLLSITNDTVLSVYNRLPYSSGTALRFQKYKLRSTAYGSSTEPVGLNFLTFDIRYIYNLAPCDSNSILFMGKTTVGNAVIARYNFKTNTISWTNTEIPDYAIQAATCSDKHVYWMGLKNNNLVVRQSTINSGTKNWEYVLPAGNQKYFVPVEQKLNVQKNLYTVSGYIVDSGATTTYRSVFYLTIDSVGTLKTFWTGISDYNMENSLSEIEVTQYGQTLIGGALYKVPYGRSGVLIEADSALVTNVVTGLSAIRSEHFNLSVQPNPAVGSIINLILTNKRFMNSLEIQLINTAGSILNRYQFKNIQTGTSILKLDGIRAKGVIYLRALNKSDQYTLSVIVL